MDRGAEVIGKGAGGRGGQGALRSQFRCIQHSVQYALLYKGAVTAVLWCAYACVRVQASYMLVVSICLW